MAIEPPPSRWRLPEPSDAAEHDVAGIGADLEPGTILAAYRSGLFPMHLEGQLAWWAPVQRAVLPLEALRVTRSLRRSAARYRIRVNTAFAEVLAACGEESREGGQWINEEIGNAYTRLHQLGWAHSVEAWTPSGELAGGLYGVAIGGLFAGESMFHHHRDASKVALAALVEILAGPPATSTSRLLDVQWPTDHLASMGAVAIGRDEYLERLGPALALPAPAIFSAERPTP